MAQTPTTNAAPPAVAYIPTGEKVDFAGKNWTPGQICSYVAKQISAYIGANVRDNQVHFLVVKDNESTHYNPDQERNEYGFIFSIQVILPSSFEHYLVDSSEEIPMLGRSSGSYNEKIREFVKRFTKLNPKSGKNVDSAIRKRGQKFGNDFVIMLNLDCVLDQMMDTSGFFYQKAFNTTDETCGLITEFFAFDDCWNARERKLSVPNSKSHGLPDGAAYAADCIALFKVTKYYKGKFKAKTKAGMPITRAKMIKI